MIEVGYTNRAGERVISIDLLRRRQGSEGLRVKVMVADEIEEFFKRWGGGAQTGMEFGRLWKPRNPADRLTLWTYSRPPTTGHEQRDDFSLIHSGGPLITEDGEPNLSMLRIVGASKGVDFLYDSVMGTTEMEAVAGRMRKACERFYLEYIQSVHMRVLVSVDDVRGQQANG